MAIISWGGWFGAAAGSNQPRIGRPDRGARRAVKAGRKTRRGQR